MYFWRVKYTYMSISTLASYFKHLRILNMHWMVLNISFVINFDFTIENIFLENCLQKYKYHVAAFFK